MLFRSEETTPTYTSTHDTTSPAANASSEAAGATAGAAVTLNNAPFYVSSTATQPATHKSGTFYFYDGILVAGRYRITNTADRCGKLPVGKNVTGWVPASYCSGSGTGGNTTTVATTTGAKKKTSSFVGGGGGHYAQ